MTENRINDKVSRCVEVCQECTAACLKAIYTDCLPRGGEYAQADFIRLLQDCAESCQVSVSFLLRGSPSAGYLCSLAARFCDRCVTECRRLGGLERCAEVCSRCSTSCHQMGKVPPQGI